MAGLLKRPNNLQIFIHPNSTSDYKIRRANNLKNSIFLPGKVNLLTVPEYLIGTVPQGPGSVAFHKNFMLQQDSFNT